MISSESPILKILSGEVSSRTPIWMMRQAGRYLPEYREVRSQVDGFLNLCLSSKHATEITLQPIRRFDFDAAIVFADILLVPYALGQNLQYFEKKGPFLSPCTDNKEIKNLSFDLNKISPVLKTIKDVRQNLSHEKALFGFAGSPWTVACYMIEGQGPKLNPKIIDFIKNERQFIFDLISIIEDASIIYLSSQIDAGANVIQLFDSWAGLLKQDNDFNNFVIKPTQKIVLSLKEKYPDVPILGFPKGASQTQYKRYLQQTNIDALSLDDTVNLTFARDFLQTIKPVQGNLSPNLLVQGGDVMKKEIHSILETLNINKKKHIMGLGHGILQETPPEHVKLFIDCVRRWDETRR